MSKIIEGLEQAVDASKCLHDFTFIRPALSGGLMARCERCRCTFTAWPGTLHYDEIVSARDLKDEMK